MKKSLKITVLVVLAVFSLTVTFYLVNRFSFANELAYYPVSEKKHDTLTVGIIGDSWVAGKKLDSLLKDGFKKKGKEINVLSSGHPGAKSKLIYQNMFKDSTDIHSSKSLIESHPDYCVVIAGVNDASGQVGAEFYSYHVEQIIKTLLKNDIKPVIVELPEFGIIESTNSMGFIKKMRNILFSKFNNKGEVDNIKTYRKNLEHHLSMSKLKDDIIFVDSDAVCYSYDNCKDVFKTDAIHLNKEGNKLLSQNIVNVLFNNVEIDY